jgi:Fe2+ transport system protein FeoA
MTMATDAKQVLKESVLCPLCSFSFEREEMRCACSCPIAKNCGMLCCPSCNYQFILPQSRDSWRMRLNRFIARWHCDTSTTTDVCTLEDLPVDREGEVVALDLRNNPQLAKLSAYGLTPGSRVQVRQRWPEYVIRVGETELAMEGSVAASIHVRSIGVPSK